MLCAIPFIKFWEFVWITHGFIVVLNRRLQTIIPRIYTPYQLHSFKKEIMLIHIGYEFHTELDFG